MSTRGRTEHSNKRIYNAVLGTNAISRRRKANAGLKFEAYRIENNDVGEYSTAEGEPLFQYIEATAGKGLDLNKVDVLPGLGGISPDDARLHVRYAGVSAVSVVYKPNQPIAVQLGGKARMQNTGNQRIRGGQTVELYPMDNEESLKFKDGVRGRRMMAGLRAARPGRGYIYDRIKKHKKRETTGFEQKQLDEIVDAVDDKKGDTTDRALKAIKAIDAYRAQHQSWVIGKAVETAEPGQYLNVMLK
jgi:hypothetical protein